MLVFLLMRKIFSKSKRKPAPRETPANAPPPATRPGRPEWERTLTASLEQNSIAPSDDVILYAFDLYCDALYAPFLERRHQMADLFADIADDIAAMQALAPDLIERAMSRHPFEFSHILEKEPR